MSLKFTLPFPPSTNALYATVGKRRVKTAAYKKFSAACAEKVLVSAIPRFTLTGQRLAVSMVCCAPKGYAYDLDNRAKATLDALQDCGIIDNDSRVDSLQIDRGLLDPAGQGYVFVTVGAKEAA